MCNIVQSHSPRLRYERRSSSVMFRPLNVNEVCKRTPGYSDARRSYRSRGLKHIERIVATSHSTAETLFFLYVSYRRRCTAARKFSIDFLLFGRTCSLVLQQVYLYVYPSTWACVWLKDDIDISWPNLFTEKIYVADLNLCV